MKIPSHEFWNKHWHVRQEVYSLLRKWEDLDKIETIARLRNLLGYYDENNFNQHHLDLYNKLAGPHGYAIYKTLLARQNR